MTNYGKLLKHANNQMTRAMDAYAKGFGLTGTQMSIIDFVGNNKQVLQRDIEAEFGIRRSTATIALERMEAHELITRKPDKQDTRQKRVALTPKSQALYQHVATYIKNQQIALESAFTPAQCRQFVKMLKYFSDLTGGTLHE